LALALNNLFNGMETDVMNDEHNQEISNQQSVIEDLIVTEGQAAKVKAGATIRVHYDTGWGNRIAIRGSSAPLDQ
jgi:FKBP-type peptidyl-prolyl cis-trans isomerase